MLEKEQWPLNNSPNLNGMEISCLGTTHEAHLKPRKVSELKIALEKIWTFFAGPINKAVPSFISSSTRAREG